MKRGTVMNYSELKELWKKEEQAAFKGWDFSLLRKQMG